MFKGCALIALAFLFCSCATHSGAMSPIRNELRQDRCDTALPKLEKMTESPSDDQLLYLMEYGSALQICRDFKKSNSILQKADKLSDELEYLSISRGVGATLLNEEMLQYKGDKFERLLLNAMGAINYLQMNDFENAMVEVRRINEKTKRFAEKEKLNFELNSFASYLAGLIYEAGGQFDDACIAYRRSFELDKSFSAVGRDLLSACWRARRTKDFKEAEALTGLGSADVEAAKDLRSKKNEKIILFLQGWGPQKVPRREDHRFPALAPSLSDTKQLMASAAEPSSSYVAFSQVVYNIEKAAIETMEEDYRTLGARRFGARVAKEVVADQIRQKDKALGDIAWLVMVASERADLRNWSLLPESVQVIRINADEVTKLKLVGRNPASGIGEDLGIIDFSSEPSKKIYVIRSLK